MQLKVADSCQRATCIRFQVHICYFFVNLTAHSALHGVHIDEPEDVMRAHPTLISFFCQAAKDLVYPSQHSDYGTGWTSGGRFPAGAKMEFFFSSPPRPDRLWGPPSLLCSVYRRLYAGGKAAQA
jgi:hypothetical protein